MSFWQRNYKTIIISLVVFLGLAFGAAWREKRSFQPEVGDFDDCARFYPVAPVQPLQCWTPEGRLFVKYSFDDERVRIDPVKGWTVRNGRVEVSGMVVGHWFFEADFPAEIWDQQGRRLALGIARAEGEWMTSDLVPFRIVFEVERPLPEEIILVLLKDNPTGLPEHDDALAWPFFINDLEPPE